MNPWPTTIFRPILLLLAGKCIHNGQNRIPLILLVLFEKFKDFFLEKKVRKKSLSKMEKSVPQYFSGDSHSKCKEKRHNIDLNIILSPKVLYGKPPGCTFCADCTVPGVGIEPADQVSCIQLAVAAGVSCTYS